MAFTVRILENEPILLASLQGSFDTDIDFSKYHSTVANLLNEQPGQVYYVLDLTHFKPELPSLMHATNEAARGDTPNFRHPNVYEVIFVTTSPIMQLTARGMDSEVFGNVRIAVFPTLDEALAHARS